MNSARVTVEREDKIIFDHQEPMDQFNELRQGIGPAAQVGMNVGTQQNFGRLKIGASVTLTCDQNEAAIDRAGYLCLTKCVQLTTLGLQFLAQEAEEAPPV
jgi:hypothetical protein